MRHLVLSLLSVFTLSAGEDPTPRRRILAGSLRVLGASALALFGLLLAFWSTLAEHPMTPTALIPWLPRGPFGFAAWFLAAAVACGGLLRLASRIDGARIVNRAQFSTRSQ